MAALNSSSGGKAVVSKAPPLVNFPLPHELRDEIYGYLLLPVKGSRKHRFHTSLFAVNHTVYEETEEYLYHNNEFVVVSFEWRWSEDAALGQLPPLNWISHVSLDHVARIRYHNMRLHFVRNGGEKLEGQSNGRAQSAILLADDLPELCLSMQVHFAGISGPAVVIGASNRRNGGRGLGISGLEHGSMLKAPEIAMELRDTKYRFMNAQLQAKLLMPFRQLTGDAVQLQITGNVPDTDAADTMKVLMGPNIVWFEAKLWKCLEALEGVKKVADRMVAESSFSDAVRSMYQSVAEESKFLMTESEFSRFASGKELSVLSARLHLECLLTIAFGELRRGNVKDFLPVCTEVKHARILLEMRTDDITEPLLLATMHARALFKVYKAIEDPGDSVAVSRFMEASMTGCDPHATHDASILECTLNTHRCVCAESLPLEDSSAVIMPPRTFGNIGKDALCQRKPARPNRLCRC